MAKSITVVGNYLIINDGAIEREFSMHNTVYAERSDKFEFRENIDPASYEIPFADVPNWDDGVNPFSVATLRTFLRENTGKFGDGGGGSGQVAEVTAFVTTALLADAATFNSGMLDASGKTQVQTEIVASHDGTIDIEFCSDLGGADVVRSLSIPYFASNGYQFFAAPAFVNFIRYKFTNNGGVTQTDFYYTTKFLTTGLSPQLLTTDAFIAGAMVTELGRSIIVGKDVGGNFNNVSVLATTNDSGTTHNLQVVSGARPSELAGRTPITVLSDNETAPILLYTVTVGKKLYITDILLTIVNGGSVTGRLEIYDALSAVGSPKLPINAADPGSGGDDTLTTFTHTFSEPMEFSTGVYFDESAGTLVMSGILIGYEE